MFWFWSRVGVLCPLTQLQPNKAISEEANDGSCERETTRRLLAARLKPAFFSQEVC
jgi:hypothetical protein